ncbi:MAG TPA: NADH-quinone oxidoreductase subunit H [Clostridia bacterium]|nr:NADH-quinone oxidoreductase subunit H [Clostridia bacterium]
MNSLTYNILQLTVMILVAPLINGIIRKVKAFTQKRKGAPLLQMYFDLFKLIKKNTVVSETSSWIFKAAPYVVITTALGAGLMVPSVTLVAPSGFMGDIILLVYLLALGRFFMMLAGLDTGSTFGGMGSSREAMISALMEPSILITLFTAGLAAGTTSIGGIMTKVKEMPAPLTQPVFIMFFLATLIIIIAETSRIPVDDPSTHLELTMVHEAMILEYSGRHLAMMELGASVKQLVFITLLVNICLPLDQLITISGIGAIVLSLLLYLVKVSAAAVLIAIIEVNTVKFRFFSVPNLAALSFILAFIGFLEYFVLWR